MAREAIIWTARQLQQSDVDALAALPYRLATEEFLFVHSSPGHPSDWEYIFGGFEARMLNDSFSERVCFVGHSHVPLWFWRNEGGRTVGEQAAPVPERRPPRSMRKGRAPVQTVSATPLPQFSLPVWRCRVCGYLCARDQPPDICPICKVTKDRFERFA